MASDSYWKTHQFFQFRKRQPFDLVYKREASRGAFQRSKL